MTVRVLLFGTYKERAGRSETAVTLDDGADVADLVRLLRAQPGLDVLPARPVVAVNRQYAAHDLTLADGDEVALIPPVAGG